MSWDELRNNVCTWLKANGIDPRRIPDNAYISLADDRLTTEEFLFDTDGKVQMVPGGHESARTTATYTITVPPPADVAEWLRPRCPTCGR